VVDEAAEARLRRRFDLRLLPVVALIYLFCFIDRANIGNAKIAGAPRASSATLCDQVVTVFPYVSYTVFELPLQLVTKKIGPGKTLPALAFLFGLFSLCMGFVQNYGQAIGVRFLLGVAESCIFPGLAFYLSRFYRKDELGFRLSCYLVCTPAAGACGGLLASGLLKIGSIGQYRSWRVIFVFEGLITMVIGIVSYFLMPDRPEACKWLSDDERGAPAHPLSSSRSTSLTDSYTPAALAEVRIKSENVGQAQAVDKLRTRAVLQGIFAPSTLVVAVVFLFNNITVQGVGFLYPTIVKTIYPNETTINLQLRTVPPYVVGAFVVLLTGYLSFKTKKRGLYLLICAPFVTVGYILYLSSMNPQVRYAAAFLVATGSFAFGAMTTTWAAANVTSDSARASAIGTVVMFGNMGGLISAWTFLPKDGPRYVPGNAFNLAGSVIMFVLTAGLWAWQVRENRAKENGRDDHYLVGKTEEEIQLLGTKNPHFRYSV
ncbi:uncharacterized protein RHOBADRAFT_11949, partial [Rhodotorula graminis WP1]